MTTAFAFGQGSESRLVGVDSELVRVVRRALVLSTQDFSVLEGLRTLERQQEYLKAGTSKTLDSRHLTGHAVDLIPYHAGGGRVWPDQVKDPIEKALRLRAFELVAAAMLEAADGLGVLLQWGNDWDGDGIPTTRDPDEKGQIPDMPHFQLPLVRNRERAQKEAERRNAWRSNYGQSKGLVF